MAKRVLSLFAISICFGCTLPPTEGKLSYPNIPFNEVLWKEQSRFDVSNNLRDRMSDDLLINHIPIGMAKAKVEEMLGKSEVKILPHELSIDDHALGTIQTVKSVNGYRLLEPTVTESEKSPGTIMLALGFDALNRLCWKGYTAE